MSDKPNRNKDTAKVPINNSQLFISNNDCEITSIYQSSDIIIENVNHGKDGVTLYAKSARRSGVCPYCGSESRHVHSRYIRKIHDLSILGKTVLLIFESRKFFCKNKDCEKKTFAEQPGNEIFRYRRHTRRSELTIIRHGLVMSSNDVTKLLSFIGIQLSSSTILRYLHRLSPFDYEGIKEIGVDDWAWRKGVSYGTIVIDLQNGYPIDLLGDRNEKSFRTWLKEHKQIKLVSRDRSTDYSSAIASTKHHVIEVADKFHLIKNIQERFAKLISEHYFDYRNKIREKESKDGFLLQREQVSIPYVHPQKVNGNSRIIKFTEVKELQQKGFNPFAISKKLGIARQTATKFCKLQELPARKSRNNYPLYDRYVEDGAANGKALKTLYVEICEMGFEGSLTPFYEHYNYLSNEVRKHKADRFKADRKVKPVDERSMIMSLKRISTIVENSIYQSKIDTSGEELIATLSEFNWFKQMYDATKSFYDIITGTEPYKLIRWMKEYWNTNLQTLKTFLLGVKKDYKAVKNTIKYDITNGITEGFVNKLKVVKRIMYGRAGLELLKRKMVMEHVFFN